MAQKIAGCRIDWKGDEYNYGDAVPDDLIEAHPDWVVDKPLTAGEIEGMSKADLQAALKELYGHEQPAPADDADDEGGEG